MAVDTLVHMVQDEWNFHPTDVTKHIVQPDVITEILRKCRLLGQRCLAGLNQGDRDHYGSDINLDFTNGVVGMSLNALDATRRLYGRDYTYQWWPDPPRIYVGTTLQVAGFTWRPYSMSLEFVVPQPATSRVWVEGHLLDINQAYCEVGRKLVTAYSQLSNVKGDEFDKLASRTQKRVNHYSSRIIRGMNR